MSKARRLQSGISFERILQMFDEGKYKIDEDEWLVLNRKDTPLKTRRSTDRGTRYSQHRNGYYPKVRLHDKDRRLEICVHKLIWMVTSRCDVPRGFEIHHDDECIENNNPDNLFCLNAHDHRKVHRLRSRSLIRERETDDTPF